MTRYEKIIEFADKWIDKFKDEKTTDIELLDDQTFSESCFDLKFKMDCGNSFKEKYQIESFDEVLDILEDVEDLDCLGSVIFSHWRYFNHWAYYGSEIYEYRDWFVKTLNRLKILAQKEIK